MDADADAQAWTTVVDALGEADAGERSNGSDVYAYGSEGGRPAVGQNGQGEEFHEGYLDPARPISLRQMVLGQICPDGKAETWDFRASAVRKQNGADIGQYRSSGAHNGR